MNTFTNRSDDASRPASTLNLLAGIWLIISPWIVGYAALPVALWDSVLVGIAVLVLSAIRLGTMGTTGLSWVNFILGVWLILSPFILAFTATSAAMGNLIILGILVVIFSLWAVFATQAPASVAR